MKISEIRSIFYDKLKEIYIDEEIDVLFFQVIDFCLQYSKIDYFLNPKKELSNQEKNNIENIINELIQNKPIQYILNKADFFGMSFYVDENVLIPRQETEELVCWIIESVKNRKNIKILDIGTGSGCIAVSLAKNLPQSEVYAIDVSEKALTIAQRNANNNNVSVQFIQQNILETEDLPCFFDVIVSNPPYVRVLEKKEMAANVIDYEPHLALFVSDEKPLIFYDKIADLAKKYLTEEGILFFEINQYLSIQMYQMLSDKKIGDIELRKDLCNNDRMIKVKIVDNNNKNHK